jgi:hypothetical protein
MVLKSSKTKQTEMAPPGLAVSHLRLVSDAKAGAEIHPELTQDVPRIELDISSLHEISGFLGACVVDSRTGATLSSIAFGDEIDIERAGAVNTEMVRAMHREMQSLGGEDAVEDILISLGGQYHLIRPIAKAPTVFVYVAVERERANLAMARSQVRSVESTLRIG